jgi:dipeptidyl aminopeptidase/acylaminoacyl peptidase
MGDGIRLIDERQVTFGLVSCEHPVFAPDGKTLAYYGGAYGWIQLFLVRADGTGVRPLSADRGNHTQPCFAPDGRHVWFRAQTRNDAPWTIQRVAIDDPADRRVVLEDRKSSFKHPSVSPDGRWLAWFSDEGSPNNFHLWKARLDGDRVGPRVRLTSAKDRNDCHPTWSPDGARLAFHAYLGVIDAGESHVFTCTADGGDVVRLTAEPGFHKHPFYVGRDLVVHHTETPTTKRHLAIRRAGDGTLVGDLTSGKHADKHPSPWVPPRGATRIAFASKKRGVVLPGAVDTFDVFWGVLDGVAVRR